MSGSRQDVEKLLISKISDNTSIEQFKASLQELKIEDITPYPSILIHAVQKHNLDIVKFLIDSKIELDSEDAKKETALAWALYAKDVGRKNKLDIIASLITAGANIQHPSVKRYYYPDDIMLELFSIFCSTDEFLTDSQNKNKNYGHFLCANLKSTHPEAALGIEKLFGLNNKPANRPQAIQHFENEIKKYGILYYEISTIPRTLQLLACYYAARDTQIDEAKTNFINKTIQLYENLLTSHYKLNLSVTLCCKLIELAPQTEQKIKLLNMLYDLDPASHWLNNIKKDDGCYNILVQTAKEDNKTLQYYCTRILTKCNLQERTELLAIASQYVQVNTQPDFNQNQIETLLLAADMLAEDEKQIENVPTLYRQAIYVALLHRDKTSIQKSIDKLNEFQKNNEIALWDDVKKSIKEAITYGESALQFIIKGKKEPLAQQNYLPAIWELCKYHKSYGWFLGPHVRRALYLCTVVMLMTQNQKEAAKQFNLSDDEINNMRKEAQEFIKSNHGSYYMVARGYQLIIAKASETPSIQDPYAFILNATKNLEAQYNSLSKEAKQTLDHSAYYSKENSDYYIQPHIYAGMKQALGVNNQWIQEKSQTKEVAQSQSVIKSSDSTLAISSAFAAAVTIPETKQELPSAPNLLLENNETEPGMLTTQLVPSAPKEEQPNDEKYEDEGQAHNEQNNNLYPVILSPKTAVTIHCEDMVPPPSNNQAISLAEEKAPQPKTITEPAPAVSPQENNKDDVAKAKVQSPSHARQAMFSNQEEHHKNKEKKKKKNKNKNKKQQAISMS